LAVIATIGTCVPAALAGADSTALTIYSTGTPGAIPPELYRPVPGTRDFGGQVSQSIPGYAIVRHERDMELAQERSTVRFSDVAAFIEPTTVTFESLTHPEGTQVIEQSFEFDLVSAKKLLQRYIGQQISLLQVRGEGLSTVTGTLLSAAGGLVLQDKAGAVKILREYDYSVIDLPSLPGGLISKPTLVWDVFSDNPGSHRVRVSYETKAMTWWADYNVVFTEGEDPNAGLLDLGAWVTIINQSGASFDDAKLKLIAGDVHRAQQPTFRGGRGRDLAIAMAAPESKAGFQEKSFFEYHLYTLGRPTTLPQNSTKQIELFTTARNVPCEKTMVYYGQSRGYRGFFGAPQTDRNFGLQSNKKVDIYLKFKNEEEIGLGMPLPSGRIRVNQRDDADGTLEFIGEDTIDHTPKDEEILIKLGSAFDVVGERRQVDFSVDNRRDTMTETIEIKVRNHKDKPVRVIIKETMYRWTNWRISEPSQNFEKVDARTVNFPVVIAKDGEATVTYTVTYTW
jgi:hypothetical protein